MRDEQVKLAIARKLPRLEGPHPKRPEPIALVNFGPSLKSTWEQIRDFQYVMSCSGSHKFLVERGITPTWQIEVDPRPHKIGLMGPPQHGVEYLIASCCHPLLFEHLKGYDVKLWHSFDANDDYRRLIPAEDWAITGGVSVGLRTFALAAFLGFRNFHIFGMDGCISPEGSHAGEHPNSPGQGMPCEYGGVTYRTTPAMLEAARGTFHELNQLPADVTPTFYGDGLVQAMAKDYVRKPLGDGHIAFAKPALISDEFRELNARLHRENASYGLGGSRHAGSVLALAKSLNTTSILDYGCGKGSLARAFDFAIFEYDPAIPGKEASPRPADLVVCTDVLEHIEPEKLMFVLDDLRRVTKKAGYFVIHTGPAKKTYADNRNTHLIQNGLEWWRAKLEKYFTIAKVYPIGVELHFLVAPKAPKAAQR